MIINNKVTRYPINLHLSIKIEDDTIISVAERADAIISDNEDQYFYSETEYVFKAIITDCWHRILKNREIDFKVKLIEDRKPSEQQHGFVIINGTNIKTNNYGEISLILKGSSHTQNGLLEIKVIIHNNNYPTEYEHTLSSEFPIADQYVKIISNHKHIYQSGDEINPIKVQFYEHGKVMKNTKLDVLMFNVDSGDNDLSLRSSFDTDSNGMTNIEINRIRNKHGGEYQIFTKDHPLIDYISILPEDRKIVFDEKIKSENYVELHVSFSPEPCFMSTNIIKQPANENGQNDIQAVLTELPRMARIKPYQRRHRNTLLRHGIGLLTASGSRHDEFRA